MIQWKSKDGATIEGVLLKPKNYDPKKKYPLLVVIHGGPTGIDLPGTHSNLCLSYYAMGRKRALVLRVNYVAVLAMVKNSVH